MCLCGRLLRHRGRCDILMFMPLSAPARPRRLRSGASSVARSVPAADSVWWLAAVAAAFTLAQLLFVSRRLGLSWDEVVYVSQVSAHVPAAYFDPARARGIPLLVAPVTLLTSSQTALRGYLSVASGLGLFLALLAWRRLRPGWILALAGLSFGGLWVAQYYGPQAMPDEWVAFSSLAAVGFFLRAAGHARPAAEPDQDQDATGIRASGSEAAGGQGAAIQAPGPQYQPPAGRPRPARPAAAAGPVRAAGGGACAGLAGCVATAALVRPGDAVFLSGALVVAVLAVPSWRRWPLLVATVIGLAAGSAEWIAEAYLRFGSPLARLRDAGAEQGGFGFHLGIWDELRALNGPTLCRPCTVGLRYPELSLWWLALPVLAILGVLAARRAGRLGSSLLAAACGLCIAFQYLFLIDYAAPRFLLPAYALLAIPVADALAWLIAGVSADTRPLTRALVVVGLAVQLLAQHLVLDHEVAGTIAFHDDYTRIVTDLRQAGIRPPCLIKGDQDIPIAYYAGCASAPSAPSWARRGADAGRIALLATRGAPVPGYARHWRLRPLPGTRVLRLIAYLPRS